MKYLLFVFSFILGLVLQLQGQHYQKRDFTTVSLGNSIVDELLPEGVEYTPFTLLTSFPIWTRGKFTVYGESQLVQAINSFNFSTEYEFGGNLGLLFIQPLSRNVNFTAAIGSGPHYVTIDTRRQADGFIFSDNVEMGFTFFIPSANTTVNVRSRFRHISNAGLQEPNGGIDNLFLVVGIGTAW